jgi:hypothetical protein
VKARKPIQNIQVAGAVLLNPGDTVLVNTKAITKEQRKWDGKIIQINDLRGGKSQIVRL